MDPLRLSGLATNIDTETIISKLMELERRPLARVDQQAGGLTAQQSAWSDLGRVLGALKDAADTLIKPENWSLVSASATDTASVSVSVSGTPAVSSYAMTVSTLARAEAVQSATFAATDTALGFAGEVSFGDKAVTIAANDTLDGLRDKINAAGAGLTATVLQVSLGSYSLLLQSSQTGTAGVVAFTDDATNTPLGALGLLDGSGVKNVVQTAQDASFKIGGVDFTRSSNTVSDALTGLSLTLRATNTTGLTLNVSRDTAAMASRLNDFVARFNVAVDQIRRHTDRGGALAGDPALLGLSNRLTSAAMNSVAGLPDTLRNLSAAGVTLERDGHLKVDSGKLNTMLGTDPAGVSALFTTAGSGLGATFSGLLDGYTRSGGTIESLAKSFDRRLLDLQNYKATLSQMIQVREANLRREFQAMEQAVSTLRSQGSWFAAQLGQLSAFSGGGNI